MENLVKYVQEEKLVFSSLKGLLSKEEDKELQKLSQSVKCLEMLV